MKARDLLHIYASIGDLKLIDYKNTLAVASLIKLLQDKGVFTEDEFQAMAESLDASSLETVPTLNAEQGQPRQARP